MDADEIRHQEHIRAWLTGMATERGYSGAALRTKVAEWSQDPLAVDWQRENQIAPRQNYSDEDVAELRRLLGEID